MSEAENSNKVKKGCSAVMVQLQRKRILYMLSMYVKPGRFASTALWELHLELKSNRKQHHQRENLMTWTKRVLQPTYLEIQTFKNDNDTYLNKLTLEDDKLVLWKEVSNFH